MNNYIIKIFSALLFGALLSACSTTQPLPDKTVNHTYTNVEFEPETKNNLIEDGLTLSVEPIDAASLNEVSLSAASRAGDYEQEVISEYLNYDSDGSLSSSEEKHRERLIEISNEIISDMNSGEISEELAHSLIERIWQGRSRGMDGSEIHSFTTSSYTSDFNPYFIGRGYLSVFKLSFNNESDKVKEVDFERFQIASGNEILYPLDMEYFEERLSGQDSKLENAFRYNLPSSMNIAPGQTVAKYLAVPAIDGRTTNLNVQYFKEDNTVTQYEFDLNQVSEEVETIMNNFIIEPDLPRNVRTISFEYYYALNLEDGTTFPLTDNNFYISENERDQTINICQVQVGKSSMVQTAYSCKDVDLSNINDRIIKISSQ